MTHMQELKGADRYNLWREDIGSIEKWLYEGDSENDDGTMAKLVYDAICKSAMLVVVACPDQSIYSIIGTVAQGFQPRLMETLEKSVSNEVVLVAPPKLSYVKDAAKRAAKKGAGRSGSGNSGDVFGSTTAFAKVMQVAVEKAVTKAVGPLHEEIKGLRHEVEQGDGKRRKKRKKQFPDGFAAFMKGLPKFLRDQWNNGVRPSSTQFFFF